MAKRTAVIDIGSNSVRMVIFEKSSRFAFHLLHEVKSRVRISECAYEHEGNLQERAIERALLALRDFTSIATSYNVRKTLCVATSAIRDAPNRHQFIRRVKQELGLNIKVISGEKEGYFGGIACANLLPHRDAITIDIGGGSTECACLENGSVVQSYSLELGTVRLKELFFDRNDIAGATAYIDQTLSQLPMKKSDHIIGIGGTFRALSNALKKRNNYPLKKLHGYQFDSKNLITFAHAILEADEEELKALGIKKERLDVIKPGTLILLRLLEYFGSKTLIASGVGVREGVYLSDLLRHSNHRFPENYNPSMRYLLDKYITESTHAQQIARLAKELFDLLHTELEINSTFRKELGIAAKLSKIGASVHFYSYHQHSYYLSQTALEYGFTHQQIMLISTLVRYQKRKRLGKTHYQTYASLLPNPTVIEGLSFILALCDALLSHRPKNIDFTLHYEKKCITVKAKSRPLYLSKEAIMNLEMPRDLSLKFL